ncbi:AraC family transcriptional regulator [Enterobacteriaceae bacterium H20N1]|uniref:AraC family transcriptional regulator n=1 Tax=Dryocola boscaweniae TaxID=2925397 RepID=A0A9X2W3T1_9ENTR|nr:AraC family transcriptional regulator [Dryocola boscaweniae]MCT4700515.1 AraC family transcriptional regulator [Dryocola boscaweniae]MCT4717671.1 AraC family transcriptional regulator [Dryocola boscaweniae]
MAALHFILFKEMNFLRLNNENVRVDANTLVVISGCYEILMPEERIELSCNQHQLLSVCEHIIGYTGQGKATGDAGVMHMVDFTESAQQTLSFFIHADRNQVIPYLIYYCLACDWQYFCHMFSSLLAQGGELIDFMCEYAFNPWPVERYAAMLGLHTRKFNYLFKESYGVTPKCWLRERRLTRARMLLEQSSLAVADIAEQSGFSNHAYFSESFRKYFSCSPSRWREKYLLNISGDKE